MPTDTDAAGPKTSHAQGGANTGITHRSNATTLHKELLEIRNISKMSSIQYNTNLK
jgi:hypothetical protein